MHPHIVYINMHPHIVQFNHYYDIAILFVENSREGKGDVVVVIAW